MIAAIYTSAAESAPYFDFTEMFLWIALGAVIGAVGVYAFLNFLYYRNRRRGGNTA